MSKEKQIKKVTLSSEGLKGLVIVYTQESVKTNRVHVDKVTKTIKHPIHLLLEDKIKDLRFHALNVAGLITDTTKKEEKASLIASSNMLSFEIGKDFFVLEIESRVFDTKFIKFSTPKIDAEDGYEFYDAVNDTLSEIVEEVHAYMKGLRKISGEEIAFMYVRQGKDKKVNSEMFDAMSAEERQAYAIKIIEEELGGFVILNEDVVDGNAEVIEDELLTLGDGSVQNEFTEAEAATETKLKKVV